MEKIKIADLEIDYKDVVKALADIKDKMKTNKEITAELVKENKELEEQGKKGGTAWQRNAEAVERNNASLKGLSTEYRANQKVLTTNLNTSTRSMGTIEKLNERNKELRLSLRGLNLETEEGKKKAERVYC